MFAFTETGQVPVESQDRAGVFLNFCDTAAAIDGHKGRPLLRATLDSPETLVGQSSRHRGRIEHYIRDGDSQMRSSSALTRSLHP
jgi:hypothetical protein